MKKFHKAYPGWIDEAVIPVLEGDPRVLLAQLYFEHKKTKTQYL